MVNKIIIVIIENNIANLESSNLPKSISSLSCIITITTLTRTKKITKLFNISAFVNTWEIEVADSTKYLFPTDPKIAPSVRSILDPKLDFGIKKTRQEIM